MLLQFRPFLVISESSHASRWFADNVNTLSKAGVIAGGGLLGDTVSEWLASGRG